MIEIITACVGSVIVIVLAIIAKVPSYHVAPAFLLPLMWAPLLLRRQLYLLPIHYAAFVLAIVIHDLGAFGFYQDSPLPFSYDIAVHFYFAFAVVLGVHHFIAKSQPQLRPWQVNLTALLFMMGFGALHEIMEYCSYLLLGEKGGMLKPTTSYVFDTARDLTNNFLGTCTALIVSSLVRWLAGSHDESRQREGLTRAAEPNSSGSLHTDEPHGHAAL